MNSYRILIADDHAMIRDGIKNLIRQSTDFTVIGEAKCGKEAIDLYLELKPDLVILDISMPDMNGMDVSKKIVEEDPDASILVLSMYDGEDYISRCLEIGVKGYVVKSESGSELEYAIRSVLRGTNYFSRQAQDIIFRKYSSNVSKRKVREEQVKLTQREVEIVHLISEGMTSQQMADKLFISPRTVETHRANLMKKLGVRNAIELVKKIQVMQLI